MTGWTGELLAHAEAERLKEVVRNGERLLSQSSDHSSQHALELRDAIADARKKAEDGAATHRKYREDLLRKLREP